MAGVYLQGVKCLSVCDGSLVLTLQQHGLGGDGYAGQARPHSRLEVFSGLGLTRAIKVATLTGPPPGRISMLTLHTSQILLLLGFGHTWEQYSWYTSLTRFYLTRGYWWCYMNTLSFSSIYFPPRPLGWNWWSFKVLFYITRSFWLCLSAWGLLQSLLIETNYKHLSDVSSSGPYCRFNCTFISLNKK